MMGVTVRPTNSSPTLSPLRFLRLVAAEYLAAYELSGKMPADLAAASADDDWPEELFRRLDEGEEPTVSAAVVDISAHPRFDASALKPLWDEQAPVRPQVGA